MEERKTADDRPLQPLPRPDDIKLIASDVDGTLLDSHHRLHPRTFHALSWLRTHRPDLPIVIATGKQHRSVAEIREPLHLGVFPSSHLNGCVVYRPGGVVANEVGLDIDVLVRLHDLFAKDRAVATFFYDHTTVYEVPGSEGPIYGEMLRGYGEDVKTVDSNILSRIRAGDIKVIKAAICQAPGPELEASRVILTKEFDVGDFTMTQAIPFCIELIPTTGSKGIALEKILEMTGLKRENTLVFGDGENDVSMFKVAGHAVAVKNAMPAAKAQATYHAPLTNDQGGVGQVLEEIYGFSYEEKPYDYWLSETAQL